jgi:hypothetical protein
MFSLVTAMWLQVGMFWILSRGLTFPADSDWADDAGLTPGLTPVDSSQAQSPVAASPSQKSPDVAGRDQLSSPLSEPSDANVEMLCASLELLHARTAPERLPVLQPLPPTVTPLASAAGAPPMDPVTDAKREASPASSLSPLSSLTDSDAPPVLQLPPGAQVTEDPADMSADAAQTLASLGLFKFQHWMAKLLDVLKVLRSGTEITVKDLAADSNEDVLCLFQKVQQDQAAVSAALFINMVRSIILASKLVQ